MLVKDSRTVDLFISCIARHLSPNADWHVDTKDDSLIHFGKTGDIRGEMVLNTGDEDNSVENISLVGGGYSDEELETIEQAIAILEGLEYAPTPDDDDE